MAMDSLITAAARALAAGDALSALNYVALREDAPALALRGIAMAQLGDLGRARNLLRKAARGFSARESVARARCVVAEAEIAFAARDLDWRVEALDAARATLERHGDHANAALACHLAIRRLLLIGRLDEAERMLAGLDPAPFPPALAAGHHLLAGGIALRRLRTGEARLAFAHAARAAHRASIPALTAEVESASALLRTPAARLIADGKEQSLLIEDVEKLQASKSLVVDACRYAVRDAGRIVSFATRPVLFELLRALAEVWPSEAARGALIARAFRGKEADDSHRVRLRVEIGRLRALLRDIADVRATANGFALVPRRARHVAVLARPIEESHAQVLAFLADGEAWSSSALALALGTGQRSVQRALERLAADGKIQSFGHGRARRWMAPPPPGFTTVLLLTGPLPGD